MSFQTFVGQGNLTGDVQFQETDFSKMAKFTLAVSRKFKDKSGQLIEEVLFLDTVVWGNQAQSCASYLKKGSPVLCQGMLKEQKWVDKTSGLQRSKIVLYADKVVFLNARTQDRQDDAPMPFGKANNGVSMADPAIGQIDFTGLDLPF